MAKKSMFSDLTDPAYQKDARMGSFYQGLGILGPALIAAGMKGVSPAKRGELMQQGIQGLQQSMDPMQGYKMNLMGMQGQALEAEAAGREAATATTQRGYDRNAAMIKQNPGLAPYMDVGPQTPQDVPAPQPFNAPQQQPHNPPLTFIRIPRTLWAARVTHYSPTSRDRLLPAALRVWMKAPSNIFRERLRAWTRASQQWRRVNLTGAKSHNTSELTTPTGAAALVCKTNTAQLAATKVRRRNSGKPGKTRKQAHGNNRTLKRAGGWVCPIRRLVWNFLLILKVVLFRFPKG